MKPARRRLFFYLFYATAAFALRTDGAGEGPAYLHFTPMVSIHATSLADTLRLLNDGLAGIDVGISSADIENRLADACFLPSFSGVDLRRPVRYFFLAPNPPSSLPESALIIPIRSGGAPILLKSLKERYANVEGGSIKICTNPIDGKSVEPLYVAIAEGNAMVSPSVDAIRWMAYSLQSGTVPEPPTFRRATLSASADSQLLGRLLNFVASLDDDSAPAKSDDIVRILRELGAFFATFQSVELTVDASISDWNASLRFVGAPGSHLDGAIAALKPPDDTWMPLFPAFASNRSASCLPGFVAALPASNRKWLADILHDTRLVGFGVFPDAFDLDEKLRPHLTGAALSAFVTDSPNAMFGILTVSALKAPAEAGKILRTYFATNGTSSVNHLINGVVLRGRDGRIAYEAGTKREARQVKGAGGAGEAVSFALNLNHVELAVRGNHLIIARGSSGLIDPWLNGSPAIPWDESFAGLTAVFPLRPGETVLGGGAVEPVALARKIAAAIPNLAEILPKMPHPGGGLVWRMARKGGEARFDLRLRSNEVIACERLRDVSSDAMQKLLGEFFLNPFQQPVESERQRTRLREKLDDLRDK